MRSSVLGTRRMVSIRYKLSSDDSGVTPGDTGQQWTGKILSETV